MGYGCVIKAGHLLAKDAESMEEIFELVSDVGAEAAQYPEGSLDLEIIDSSYGNYHQENYEPLAELCRNGSYLDFFGDDDCAWSLVVKDGKLHEIGGSVEWSHELHDEPPKIVIPLDNGYELVAERNSDTDYKEIFVFLRKDGVATQDLAIIAEQYSYDEARVVPIHGAYSVKVYSEPDNEDFTYDFGIGRWEDPEEEGGAE